MVMVSGAAMDLSVWFGWGYRWLAAVMASGIYDLNIISGASGCLLLDFDHRGLTRAIGIAYWKIRAFIRHLGAGMLVVSWSGLMATVGRPVYWPFFRKFFRLFELAGFVPDVFGVGRPNVTALVLVGVGRAIGLSLLHAWPISSVE